VAVSGHIDVDRARRRTWDVARLHVDPVGLEGKHNGQGPAVDILNEQMPDLMDSGWREYMLMLARAECHFLPLADHLELWQVR
jgi:hypothetical protein